MADPHPSARFGQAPIRWTAERRPGADPVVAELVAGYLSELRTYMPDFDPTEADPPAAGDFDWPSGTFVVVMASGEPAGCGGIRRLADEVGELRRMWVRPAWRTVGAGRLLLTELEAVGREMGLAEIRLDTSHELTAALSLYRSSGYQDIARYNENPFADRWLSKRL